MRRFRTARVCLWQLCRVHLGVGNAHFFGYGLRRLNLNERPLIHPWAAKGSLVPGRGGFDNFRPERKNPALHRFYWMDRALSVAVKETLTIRGFTQTQGPAGTVNVLGFKLGRIHRKMSRNPAEILLGKIDLAFHLATGRTARLALEPEAVYFANSRFTPVVIIRSFFWKPGSGLLT
jgi:hypothetical protein